MPCKPPVESSPRMQGALPSAENHSKHYRIIPADAGSTPRHTRGHPMCRDHPRECGEHRDRIRYGAGDLGSSPRMRGALDLLVDLGARPGIIPADAGSTSGARSCTGSTRDHPRGCGEHSLLWPTGDWANGSSPRMRGARAVYHKAFGRPGIIPADAGSTYIVQEFAEQNGDHPRGCGEHESFQSPVEPTAGSSPRMRGALGAELVDDPPAGIIPANAGSTLGR